MRTPAPPRPPALDPPPPTHLLHTHMFTPTHLLLNLFFIFWGSDIYLDQLPSEDELRYVSGGTSRNLLTLGQVRESSDMPVFQKHPSTL